TPGGIKCFCGRTLHRSAVIRNFHGGNAARYRSYSDYWRLCSISAVGVMAALNHALVACGQVFLEENLMKLVKKTLLSTLCLGAFATAAVTAQAADTVKLRLADSFPTGHYIPDAMTKPFMEAVTEQTDGAVEFEYYPAEQMGKSKDMLSLTQSGVVDIAYVAPAFVSDKLPLGVVAELPGGFTESCEGTQAYWKLAQEGGILHEKE